MQRRDVLATAAMALTTGVAGCVTDDTAGRGAESTTETGQQSSSPSATAAHTVERVAEGLRSPWGITHLPSGDEMLVTEQPGTLVLLDIATGSRDRLSGVPEVYARGQGGLLDVALHPSFPDESWVYLTYSRARPDGTSSTHLGRGRLDRENAALTGFEQLHAATPFVESTGHFGSRVIFGPDDLLYMSVGDRQFKNFGPDHVAQDTTNELGTVLRLTPDGRVPESNPFADDPERRDTIFTFGHRNPQGLTVHPRTGDVWATEFGEQDGDEINVLRAGANYGWPIADEGCTYGSGEPIGVSHDDREDVQAPVFTWECGTGGFPPSGTTFYDGGAFPEWQNDLLIGGLASQYLARFRVGDGTATEAERLLGGRGWRIRALSVGPQDGYLYAVIDADPAPVVRLVPS